MKNETVTEGQTPGGRTFRIIAGYDPSNSHVLYRSLQWNAHGDVGPIGVPLKLTAPVGQLFFELTRHGEMTEATHKLSVNA